MGNVKTFGADEKMRAVINPAEIARSRTVPCIIPATDLLVASTANYTYPEYIGMYFFRPNGNNAPGADTLKGHVYARYTIVLSGRLAA